MTLAAAPDALLQPNDVRAEKELLGAAMVTDCLGSIQAEVGLAADDFFQEKHRLIFRAMLELVDNGDPINALSVESALEKRGTLAEAGGPNELAVLSMPDTPGHSLYFAGVVKDRSRWRKRFDAGRIIREAAHARDDDRFAEGQALLAEGVSHQNAVYDEDRQRDLLFELLEGQAVAEFYWPVEKLNRLQSGGMRRGNLIVLSGYTNEGKSHFADQILDSNRKHGRVCLYDNEMNPAERAARRATRLSGVPYGELMDGKLNDHERSKFMKHLNEDFGWPIVDTAGWTVEEVCHHIRQFRWGLCVVDILHNFPFSDERELSASVARLKATAKQADCCVVLVCHVNRGGVERGHRRRPVRSDLRWSGDIENLADVVCFVYREQDPDTFESLADGAVYFDKCRGGKLGGEAVRFNPDRLRFEAKDRPQESAGAQW